MMEDDVGANVLMEVEDLEASVMRAHLALQQFIRERKRDKEFDVDELPVGGVVSLSFSLLPEVRRQLEVVRDWLRNSQTTAAARMETEEEEGDNNSVVGPEEEEGEISEDNGIDYDKDPLTGVKDEEGESSDNEEEQGEGPHEAEVSVDNNDILYDKDPLMGVVEEEGGRDDEQVSNSNYTGITPNKGKRRRRSRKQNSNGNGSTLSGSGTSEGEDVEDDQVEVTKLKAAGFWVKRRDPIWKEFVLTGDYAWKCKFCDYQLKQPNASRLKDHVYRKCESRPPRLNTDAIGLEAITNSCKQNNNGNSSTLSGSGTSKEGESSDNDQVSIYTGTTPKGKRRRRYRKQSEENSPGGSGISEGEDDQMEPLNPKPIWKIRGPKQSKVSRKQIDNSNEISSGTSEEEDIEDDKIGLLKHKPIRTVQRKDPVWKEFTITQDQKWKCKFCDYKVKQPRADRFKVHVYSKCKSRPPSD